MFGAFLQAIAGAAAADYNREHFYPGVTGGPSSAAVSAYKRERDAGNVEQASFWGGLVGRETHNSGR